MDSARVDQIIERVILAFLLGILVFSPLAFGSVRSIEFGIVVGLTLVMLLLWMVRLWISPQTQLLWPPVCWAVMAFCTYAVARASAAVVEFDAREEQIQVLVYAILFFAILNNLYRQDYAKIIVGALVCVGLALSIYAIAQFMTHNQSIWNMLKPETYAMRGSGTFVNPNHLAGYLVMVIPAAVAFTIAGRLSHSLRILCGYATVVMLIGVAVSLSRGGWVALFVALVSLTLVLGTRRQHRVPVLLLLLCVLAAGLFFYSKAEKKIQARVSAAMTSGHDRDVRWRIWPAALQVWQENPWLGVGPAQFDHHYRKYRLADNHSQTRPRYAHNEYLNTLADYGIVGVLLVALVWALLLGGAVRAWKILNRSAGNEEELRGGKRAFILGSFISLLAILTHSVVDFQFHVPANVILAVTLMALLAGHFRFSTDKHWVPLGVAGKLLATLAMLGLAVFLVIEARPWVTGEYWRYQAADAATRAEQIDALQKALEADPGNPVAAYQLGEVHRRWSWEGDDDYAPHAEEAMTWFRRAMDLNPLDPYPIIHYGMCLHWLGKHAEAGPYFEQALKLDPNHYYVLCQMGWHYFQLRQYAKAKAWLDRSLRVNWWDNRLADAYSRAALQRITEEQFPPQNPK